MALDNRRLFIRDDDLGGDIQMIEKVISGGQTGADIAGIRAAKTLEIPTGGWIPRGFKTQEGNKPQYAELYGLTETRSEGYPDRTRMNVLEADATLRFADNWSSPGELLTARMLDFYEKPYMNFDANAVQEVVEDEDTDELHTLVWTTKAFLEKYDVRVLNIAGNTERTRPGIESVVFRFLVVLFLVMKGE